jgi:outer membrane protein TolC
MYKILLSITTLFLLSRGASAQKNIQAFSLIQTVDYAMKNAVEIRNALIDIDMQRQTNREITALAMPQVSANVGATRFFDIPTTTLPDFISPSVYGVLVNNGVKDGNGNPINFPANGFGFVPARFGTNWNASGGFEASQILFDGQIFVGLQARSASMKLARQSADVTKEMIKANVMKMYYQLVVGQRQKNSIDVNIDRFEKLHADATEIYKNGLIEKLDLDKIDVQLNNLKTEKYKVENQLLTGMAALKFMIQLPQQDSLILTDSISSDAIQYRLSADSFSMQNRKEYQQLMTALELNKYNIKRYQLSRVPTLAAFGSLSRNAQRNVFNFFQSGEWFPTSLVGIKMTVPIFDGFSRHARIQKAKYELNKLKNNVQQFEQAVEFEISSARLKWDNAIQTVTAQERNVKLAESVFNQTKLKYEQGVGSTTEIYNAQTDYKVSENNYYAALYDAIIAKIDLMKALGKL